MILRRACSEGLSSDPAAGHPGWGISQDTGRIDPIRGALLVSYRARELVFFHFLTGTIASLENPLGYHAAEILANSLFVNWAQMAAANNCCTIQNSFYLPAFESSNTFLEGWPFSVATVPFQ